jgi:hypothetical protein
MDTIKLISDTASSFMIPIIHIIWILYDHIIELDHILIESSLLCLLSKLRLPTKSWSLIMFEFEILYCCPTNLIIMTATCQEFAADWRTPVSSYLLCADWHTRFCVPIKLTVTCQYFAADCIIELDHILIEASLLCLLSKLRLPTKSWSLIMFEFEILYCCPTNNEY